MVPWLTLCWRWCHDYDYFGECIFDMRMDVCNMPLPHLHRHFNLNVLLFHRGVTSNKQASSSHQYKERVEARFSTKRPTCKTNFVKLQNCEFIRNNELFKWHTCKITKWWIYKYKMNCLNGQLVKWQNSDFIRKQWAVEMSKWHPTRWH